MLKKVLLMAGVAVLLAGCASNSRYGVPAETWNKLTPAQKQQIMQKHKAKSSHLRSGGSGFVVEDSNFH